MKDDQLIDVDALAQFFAVSKRTIWRWVANGILPRPVPLTRRIRRWRRSEIEALIARAQARQAERVVTA